MSKKIRARKKMGETTSFTKNEAFQGTPPPPLTPIDELATICNSNQNPTIPKLKRINNNIPTDIHTVLGTSPGKLVLINKDDKLHQVVVPNNVVLSQDAGPAQVNIPEVGPVTIKIDPEAKNRHRNDQRKLLYLEYNETPSVKGMNTNDIPLKLKDVLQPPDSSQEGGCFKGYTPEDIQEARRHYDAIKSIMEQYENEFEQNAKLFKLGPSAFDIKTMKLDKALSVFIDRNDLIEKMCGFCKKEIK